MVAILTVKQKDLLIGVEFIPDNTFNPIQDINDNWIISEEEINQSEIQWLKELPLTEYQPKEVKSNIIL